MTTDLTDNPRIGWKLVCLGDLCEVESGFAWPSEGYFREAPGIPIVRIQNLDENDRSSFIYWRAEYDRRYIVHPGDVLLSLSGSFKTCVWQGPECLLNQRIVRLVPRDTLTRDWLLRSLEWALPAISGMGKLAIVNNVSVKDLRKLKMMLPTLSEQKRMVVILAEQMAAVEKARSATEIQLEAITNLRTAILRQVFEGNQE